MWPDKAHHAARRRHGLRPKAELKPKMDIPRDKLLWIYETMATIRSFEMRGFHEVTSRAISAAIHRSVGQEAVPTGTASGGGPRLRDRSRPRLKRHLDRPGKDHFQEAVLRVTNTTQVWFAEEGAIIGAACTRRGRPHVSRPCRHVRGSD